MPNVNKVKYLKYAGLCGTFVGLGLLINYVSLLISGTLFKPTTNVLLFTLLTLFCSPILPFLPLILVYFLRYPIVEGDALSIWFFQARMIYERKGIHPMTGFTDVAIASTNMSYPKMCPSIAAQLMTCFGFWNNYLPKMSLILMLIPAILWVVSLFEKTIGFLFILAMLAVFLPFCSTAMMDGFIAIYAGFALVWLNRWFADLKIQNLINFTISLSFCLSIKLEGKLVLCMILFSFTSLCFVVRKKQNIKKIYIFFVALFFAMVPFLIWEKVRIHLNIQAMYPVGINTFNQVILRLKDLSALILIGKWVIFGQKALPGVLMFLLITLVYERETARRTGFVFLSAALFYVGLIFFVYLATPYDLEWHLRTSAARTIMPALSLGLGGIYAVLHSKTTVYK